MRAIRTTYIVVLLLAVLFGLSGGINAANMEAKLPSSDGSDAFDVQDSGGISLMNIFSNGNVGIGDINPGSKLTVAGTIETTSGGIKFPDGSIQITAGGFKVMANGQYIGDFLSDDHSSVIRVLTKQGYTVGIRAFSGNVAGTFAGPVFYTTNDCSGTKYSLARNGIVISAAGGGLYYVPKDALPANDIFPQSEGYPSPDAFTCREPSGSSGQFSILLPNDSQITGVDSNTSYNLPITIER